MCFLPQVLSFVRTQRWSGVSNSIAITIVVKRVIVEGQAFAYLVFSSREKRFHMV